MRVAVVGSRSLNVDISKYIPDGTTEIISGGAKGIDTLAEKYADEHNIPKLIIKPEYEKYGIAAPLKRNEIIVDISDMVIAIWDGQSRGTKFVIDNCKQRGVPVTVFVVNSANQLVLKG